MSGIIVRLLFVTFALMVLVLSAAAQNNQLLVQLVDYDTNTQQSEIHIQNTAGFELNELDLYINSIRTGRISNKLADGKAVLYYQTITPGTYSITIKTKEGIEFTQEIKFEGVKQTAEQQAEATTPKTASQLAEDPEYQEYLREKQIEQEIRKQSEEAEIQKAFAEKIVEKREIGEEKLEEIIVQKPAERQKYPPIIFIALILIFIFILIYFLRKKRK